MTNIAIISTAGSLDIDGRDGLLDGLFAAQEKLGQISWALTDHYIAHGVILESETRVVVVDTDNAPMREAVRAAMWVVADE